MKFSFIPIPCYNNHVFTGIIREIGFLKAKKLTPKNLVFEITAKKLKPKLGDSIAVNGACLTVTKKTAGGFNVEVIPETLQRTNLNLLKEKAKLNLEPSIKASERFDGHFVLGHIDGICRVLKNGKIKYGTGLALQCPSKLMRFISEKGSVAINGVSLTVAEVKQRDIIISLIPLTKKNTNLGKLKKGDMVNIEIDVIARYLERLQKHSPL